MFFILNVHFASVQFGGLKSKMRLETETFLGLGNHSCTDCFPFAPVALSLSPVLPGESGSLLANRACPDLASGVVRMQTEVYKRS